MMMDKSHIGRRWGLAFLGVALASACASPQTDGLTLRLPAVEDVALTPAPGDVRTDWWRQFEDETLNSLIGEALGHNRDLAAAEANIRAAQALLRTRRLDRQPITTTTANGQAARDPFPGGRADSSDIEGSFNGGIGASWEWDAFGRLAAQIKAARFDAEAARQTRRDVAVTVAADTALAYADFRGAQRRLAVARSNADAQRQTRDLLQTLFENGRATELDVTRAEAQFRTTAAGIPIQKQAAENAISRLAALTGQSAFDLENSTLTATEVSGSIPALSGPLIGGDLAKMVERRPDVREAEARLARALALSDAARANLFPTVTFNADVTSFINENTQFEDEDYLGFSVGPAIRWAGPDLRRERLAITIADAEAEAAMRNYEQAVIRALSEVDIALTNYARERERREDLVAAAQSAARALELAQLRFEEGLDDFLDVLDSQRTLLVAEDQLAASRLQAARNTITVYRTLGGMLTDNDLTKASTWEGKTP